MIQNVQQECIAHKNQNIDSLCVKENCCKKLKCPQCEKNDCKIIKLSTITLRFKQFKDDLIKLMQQIDNYHMHIIPTLQQNQFELIHQDIVNTQNLISVLQDHLNIIIVRSAIGEQGINQQQQTIVYDSNLQCRILGHEQLKITSINLNRQPGDPKLFCNLCNVNLQYAKDFNSIRKICQDYVNLKEIKEIQNLQLQHYDQYLKKFRQLTNLVEEQTMYNYIKDKLTYFENKELNLTEIFDDKFVLFLRPKIDIIDDVTKKNLQQIKKRLEQNNIDKIDISKMGKQILYKFNVDYNFKNELPSDNGRDDQTFYGPKLTANLNYIQLVTIHDPQTQLLINTAKINFIDINGQIVESFTVYTDGIIKYNDKLLNEKFTKQIEKSHLFQINFYLFLSKEMRYYILISYQGQMMLKQLQNTRNLMHLQVEVYLNGKEAYGRIVTQQF